MKKRILLLFLALYLNSNLISQEMSPHFIDLQRHKNTPTTPELIGDHMQQILPLQSRLKKIATPEVTVFGYLPYWIRSQAYAHLRFDLLTHIAIFSIEVNADGSLGNAHGWPWNDVINRAHSAGVKVILTATLFSGSDILTLISNPTYKQRFFEGIKAKMVGGQADGVNIDFEGGRSSGWPAKINAFMAELTDYLHREIPGSEVSFAAPVINWGQDFDLPGLAQSCDYLFIMGYAFWGSWSTTSGPNSPLTGPGHNISSSLNSDYNIVVQNTPDRLVLGLPYYGHHWKTATGDAGSSVIEFMASTFFSSSQPGSETYGLLWHESSQTPWYKYHDGDTWHQVWFDDDSSLGLKYDFAMSKNLRGVGMWALGYDGARQELWNLIDFKFGSGQQPVPTMPLSLRILHNDATSVKVEFEAATRATGYFIYRSSDGLTFTDSLYQPGTSGVVDNLQADSLYFFRMRAVNATGLSAPTEVLAAVPKNTVFQTLVVNGFDRTAGTNNTLDYIRQHAQAIHAAGFGFSSASNEAIYRNQVSLCDFKVVDWILGDESTADDTFNSIEQDSIKVFLDSGGRLFVSGSEIGWDLQEKGSSADRDFYHNYLKADYVDDAPNGQKATYYSLNPVGNSGIGGSEIFTFDDGSQGTFEIDWPDAIRPMNGSDFFMEYTGVVSASSGGAGVLFKGLFPGATADTGAVATLAVPFETIYPQEKREMLMADILEFLSSGIEDSDNSNTDKVPDSFSLLQNYPNPFNSRTTIAYELPLPGSVELVLFNIRGEKVWRTTQNHESGGQYSIKWHGQNSAGLTVSSGIYYYRVRFAAENGQIYRQSRRMSFLK